MPDNRPPENPFVPLSEAEIDAKIRALDLEEFRMRVEQEREDQEILDHVRPILAKRFGVPTPQAPIVPPYLMQTLRGAWREAKAQIEAHREAQRDQQRRRGQRKKRDPAIVKAVLDFAETMPGRPGTEIAAALQRAGTGITDRTVQRILAQKKKRQ